jgi:hypothetical protein
MHRREFLAALAAAAGAAAAPAWAGEPLGLRDAAREAWLYCLPLIEMAQVRARTLAAGPGGRVNVFNHARALAGPANRGVTTPNTDTLYSSAWIDLSGEPATLTLPPTGNRYFSLALMDMYSNNFAVLGTRTTGGDGGVFTLAGPRGPAEPGAIRSPTNWVWALGRTLVDGPADLDAVHAIQNRLAITAPTAGRVPGPPTGRGAPWNEYFAYAQMLIADNSPPATDLGFFRRIRALQLGLAHGFEQARFSNEEMEIAAAGVEDAKALLRAPAPEPVIQGWTYPDPRLGDFGQNYALRARTALGALAALPPQEAMYLFAVAPDGSRRFDGDGRWRLHLPGPLPVDGFWSLTMYEATADGQFFMTENPAHRYAIGDRTSGLRRGADGSIDIVISRSDPVLAGYNWLPAPASGPWTVVLRAYLPKPELLDGRYRVPALAPDTETTEIAATPGETPQPPGRRRSRHRRRH